MNPKRSNNKSKKKQQNTNDHDVILLPKKKPKEYGRWDERQDEAMRILERSKIHNKFS